MANVKTGFDYYKVDTDRYQDRRIKKLRKNYGCVGLAVYDYLLCEIYRDKGCFAAWDEDTAFDVAEYLGIKENTVAEVVRYCGAVGLFDTELLSRGIVTSKSIQRRFVEMSVAARRTTIVIPADVCLTEELPKMYEECGDNVGRIGQNVGIMQEECGDSSHILPQSKVKYSKEKKRKENIYLSISPSFEVDESERAEASSAEREKIFEIFFLKNFRNPAQEVDRFYAHYEAQGWKRGGGVAITDRIALAQSWKPENEKNKHFPDDVAQLIRAWYQAGSTELRKLLATDLDTVVVDDGTMYCRCSAALRNEIENNQQHLAPSFRAQFPNHRLRYIIPS